MGTMNRLRQLQRIAQDPANSEVVQALITIVVSLEERQLAAVEALHDAQGIEGVDNQVSEEERREQLRSLVNALASGSVRDWWFREVAGEHIHNAEDAKAYAGLDADEWQEQKATWAETYRERADGDLQEYSDDDLAGRHVEQHYGVSLQEFREEVVEWSEKEALQTVIAGRFQAVEAGIQMAANEARGEA